MLSVIDEFKVANGCALDISDKGVPIGIVETELPISLDQANRSCQPTQNPRRNRDIGNIMGRDSPTALIDRPGGLWVG